MPSSPKAFYARPSSKSRRSTVLITFCVILGLSAFFGLYAMVRSALSSRCGDVKPLSVSVTWDKSSSGSSSGGATSNKGQKRHKVMGFVGVQTGFASAGRRRSLRQTWFPSDHKGLKRYSPCFLSNFVLKLHFCSMMPIIYCSRNFRNVHSTFAVEKDFAVFTWICSFRKWIWFFLFLFLFLFAFPLICVSDYVMVPWIKIRSGKFFSPFYLLLVPLV